jgi:chaperonin cofactor prefoldin
VILSVDTQKVFERYNEAQEARAAYGEVVATTNKELKEMHEEIEKLDDKVNAIREKSENTIFIEAAREKYRKEVEEKEEMLHIKTDEFYHKSMNDDLVKRGKMRKCLNIKAINEAEV